MTRKRTIGAREDDFVAVEYSKEEFGTLNLNRKVMVKTYAPKTFQRVRQMCGIEDIDILQSLDPSKNVRPIQNAGLGAGASGSFFFFSFDKKFILKTMTETEIN